MMTIRSIGYDWLKSVDGWSILCIRPRTWFDSRDLTTVTDFFFGPPCWMSTQWLSSSNWLARGGRRSRCVHFCAIHSQCLPKTVKGRVVSAIDPELDWRGRGYWDWARLLGKWCWFKNWGATAGKNWAKRHGNREITAAWMVGVWAPRVCWRSFPHLLHPGTNTKRSKITSAVTSIALSLVILDIKLLGCPVQPLTGAIFCQITTLPNAPARIAPILFPCRFLYTSASVSITCVSILGTGIPVVLRGVANGWVWREGCCPTGKWGCQKIQTTSQKVSVLVASFTKRSDIQTSDLYHDTLLVTVQCVGLCALDRCTVWGVLNSRGYCIHWRNREWWNQVYLSGK